MKHALTGLLLAGATCAFVLVTPAVAQVAGNPGDLHTPTVYTSEGRRPDLWLCSRLWRAAWTPRRPDRSDHRAHRRDVGRRAGGAPCGVSQDFNGRYTALCGL